MKRRTNRFVAWLLSVAMLAAMFPSVLPTTRAARTDATLALEARIDALPSVEDAVKGDSTTKAEIVAIHKTLYNGSIFLRDGTVDPPDLEHMAKLRAVAAKVMTIKEQFGLMPYTGTLSGGSGTSLGSDTGWFTAMKSHYPDQADAFKDWVKTLIQTNLYVAPISERAGRNDKEWDNVLNNHVGMNSKFFSPCEWLEAFSPADMETVNRVLADENMVAWLKTMVAPKNASYSFPCFMNAWRMGWNGDGSVNGMNTPEARAFDMTALFALSKEILSLQERIDSLPGYNAWVYMGMYSSEEGVQAKQAQLTAEVAELYDKIFKKTALEVGEVYPSSISNIHFP